MVVQDHIFEDLNYVEFVSERKLLMEKFPEWLKFHGNTMSRSKKKGPYIDERLMKKVLAQKNSGTREPIRTWVRSCQIPPEFVGHVFAVHNGKKHIEVRVIEAMVGHRLGEFALTRTFKGHGKVTKRVLEKT